MGRRALPKLKTVVDFSGHLLKFEDFSPWTPDVWFGRAAPLHVEVGSGKGLFLQNTAGKFPEGNFLGMEIAHAYARFAAYRCAKHGLSNVRVGDVDALRVFREIIPDNALQTVHVYFPDPWWKKRHHKRRVMNEQCVQDITRTLTPGGSLHFWTDVEDYYQMTAELLAQRTPLLGPQFVPEAVPENELDYRTHRERRVRKEGLQVFRTEYLKPIP